VLARFGLGAASSAFGSQRFGVRERPFGSTPFGVRQPFGAAMPVLTTPRVYGAAAVAAAAACLRCKSKALQLAGASLLALVPLYAALAPEVAPGVTDPRGDDPDDGANVFAAVLDSLPSLEGKCVCVTGATSGLGLQVARAAVLKRAALLICVNRDSPRSALAWDRLDELSESVGGATAVHTVDAEFLSLESVKAAAGDVAALAPGGVDVLACNAGLFSGADARSRDGYDATAQVSVLAHVLLTKLLLPSLKVAAAARGEARVVQHHSGQRNNKNNGAYDPERYLGRSPPGALGGDAPGGRFARYGQAKLSQAVFAMELHRRLGDHGKVKSLSAEPGLAKTSLGATFLASFPWWNPLPLLLPFAFPLARAQPASHGVVPLLRACFDAEAESGDLWMPASWVTAGDDPTALAAKARPLRAVAAGVADADAQAAAVRGDDEVAGDAPTLDPAHGARLWAATDRVLVDLGVGRFLVHACRDTYAGTK